MYAGSCYSTGQPSKTDRKYLLEVFIGTDVEGGGPNQCLAYLDFVHFLVIQG